MTTLPAPHLNIQLDTHAPERPLRSNTWVIVQVTIGPALRPAPGLVSVPLVGWPIVQRDELRVRFRFDGEQWQVQPARDHLSVEPEGFSTNEALFMLKPLRPGAAGLSLELTSSNGAIRLAKVAIPTFVAGDADHRPLPARSMGASIASGYAVNPRDFLITLSGTGDHGRLAIRRPDGSSYSAPLPEAAVGREFSQRLRGELQAVVERMQDRYKGSLSLSESDARWLIMPLARAGREVWRQIFSGHHVSPEVREQIEALRQLPVGGRVQVVLDEQMSPWILPWALLYDRDLDKHGLEWEGFWGARYLIDVLVPSPLTNALLPSPPLKVLMLLNDEEELRPLTAEQVRFLQEDLSGVQVEICHGHAQVDPRLSLPNDAALVYCFCHSDHYHTQLPSLPNDARLRFSSSKVIPLDRLRSWPVSQTQRPLVLLNACRSTGGDSAVADGLMFTFIFDHGALGFIGTEVETPQNLAHDIALRFLCLLSRGDTVSDVLWKLRRHYLDQFNILAFNYNLYCLGDVRLESPIQCTSPLLEAMEPLHNLPRVTTLVPPVERQARTHQPQ